MRYENNKIVYEVGDWIVGHSAACGQVVSHGGNGVRYNVAGDGGYQSYYDSVRPATQEEIDKATKEEKIMVGEYEVKFFQNTIEVGCVAIHKELFKKIGKKAGWL